MRGVSKGEMERGVRKERQSQPFGEDIRGNRESDLGSQKD